MKNLGNCPHGKLLPVLHVIFRKFSKLPNFKLKFYQDTGLSIQNQTCPENSYMCFI